MSESGFGQERADKEFHDFSDAISTGLATTER
jgi:hypothetical protein